jgi:hypothetical protein
LGDLETAMAYDAGFEDGRESYLHLLKVYIEHIGIEEGVDFLGYKPSYMDQDDYDMLFEISRT